tara:strand:+ start:342 stop:860 length:519 start_codon:yes stop_codon:yes gene_type:complete
MAFRRRFQVDANDAIADIVRGEFPSIPVYEGNYKEPKSMFFKIDRQNDTLLEMRRGTSNREYSINLQLHVKSPYPTRRNASLKMALRNAERVRQLLYSYRNQLLATLSLITSDGKNFLESSGLEYRVRRSSDDSYNYHDLNVNNVNINVNEDKNYFIFDFSIDADIEKLASS